MKSYRTLIFGIVLAGFGFMETFDWTSVLSENYAGVVVILVGAAVVWLRSITNSPMLSGS